MIVYKCLSPSGLSQHQSYKWPLPDEEGDEPGAWVEERVTPVICRAGLHGYLTLDMAKAQGSSYDIYEMELDDGQPIVKGEGRHADKACGTRARLLRKVWDREGEVRYADLVWQ